MYQSAYVPRVTLMNQGARSPNVASAQPGIDGSSYVASNMYKSSNPGYFQMPFFPQIFDQDDDTSGFWRAFSHLPCLSSSMSTKAKGIIGFIITILCVLIILAVVLGLIPVYINAANSNLRSSDPVQPFTIDVKNGLQLSSQQISNILNRPEQARTQQQNLTLASSISSLTSELNDEAKSKLDPNIEKFYNVRYNLNRDNAVNVSFSIKTKPISQVNGLALKAKLASSLKNPKIFDDVNLDSNTDIVSHQPDENSISNLIPGEISLKSVNLESTNTDSNFDEIITENNLNTELKKSKERPKKKKSNTDESKEDSKMSNEKNSGAYDLQYGPLVSNYPYENYNQQPQQYGMQQYPMQQAQGPMDYNAVSNYGNYYGNPYETTTQSTTAATTRRRRFLRRTRRARRRTRAPRATRTSLLGQGRERSREVSREFEIRRRVHRDRSAERRRRLRRIRRNRRIRPGRRNRRRRIRVLPIVVRIPSRTAAPTTTQTTQIYEPYGGNYMDYGGNNYYGAYPMNYDQNNYYTTSTSTTTTTRRARRRIPAVIAIIRPRNRNRNRSISISRSSGDPRGRGRSRSREVHRSFEIHRSIDRSRSRSREFGILPRGSRSRSVSRSFEISRSVSRSRSRERGLLPRRGSRSRSSSGSGSLSGSASLSGSNERFRLRENKATNSTSPIKIKADSITVQTTRDNSIKKDIIEAKHTEKISDEKSQVIIENPKTEKLASEEKSQTKSESSTQSNPVKTV